MQDFLKNNQSYYEKHEKQINSAHNEEAKIKTYLEFLGISNDVAFNKLLLTEKVSKIEKLYRAKALIFHPDKVSNDNDKNLAHKIFSLLNTAADEVKKYFLKQSDSQKNPSYLQQKEKVYEYQYELAKSDDFYKSRLSADAYAYGHGLIGRGNVQLWQNWEDDFTGQAIVNYEDNSKVYKRKIINVDGRTAFYHLLSSGVIFSYTLFDKSYCNSTVNSGGLNLQYKVLIHPESNLWMHKKDRLKIAQNLIKAEKYNKDALTKIRFNELLSSEQICNIAFQEWELKTPEDVFIYYYDKHPDLLKTDRFFKIKNLDKSKILKHLTENPHRIALLETKDITVMASEPDFQKIIFENPTAHAKLMESNNQNGNSYWKIFIDKLFKKKLYPTNTKFNFFEKFCIQQFLMGKLSAQFFSIELKNIIQSHIENKDNHLPSWMIELWLNAEEISDDEQKKAQAKFENTLIIELFKGHFSVLNYLSENVLISLSKNEACKNFVEKVSEKINNPSKHQNDLMRKEELQFLADNFEILESLLEDNMENYLSSEDFGSIENLNAIEMQYAQVQKMRQRLNYLNNTPILTKNLQDLYNKNKQNILCANNLALLEKSKIKKISILCHKLELIKHNDDIEKLISSLFSKIIHRKNDFEKNPIYQSNHVEDSIFGIKINENLDMLDALEKLFDACQMLDITNIYYTNLNKCLDQKEGILDESNPDIFPRENIKNILLAYFRNEFSIFIDGERKNHKTNRVGIVYLSDQYELMSFEDIRKSYYALGAEEEYKQGLSEAYNKILKGKVLLEKYYEIRKHEKDIISPELEHLALQKELSDVSEYHFPKSSDKGFWLGEVFQDKFKKSAQSIGDLQNKSAPELLQIEDLKNNSKKKGTEKKKYNEQKLSQEITVLQTAHPIQIKTRAMLEKLQEIADNYNPDEIEHERFIRDFKNPMLSPILFEFFKSVDENNKEDVRKAAQSILNKYQNLTVSDIQLDKITIRKNATLFELKERQNLMFDAIYNAFHYETDKLRKKISSDFSVFIIKNRYFIMNPPNLGAHNDSLRYDLATWFIAQLQKISELNWSKIIKNKITKFLFIHLNEQPSIATAIEFLYERNNDLGHSMASMAREDYINRELYFKNIEKYSSYAEFTLSLWKDKNIANSQNIELLLKTLENYSRYDKDFSENVANLILFLSKNKQAVNYEKIKDIIDKGELEFVNFFYQYENSLPKEHYTVERLKKYIQIVI